MNALEKLVKDKFIKTTKKPSKQGKSTTITQSTIMAPNVVTPCAGHLKTGQKSYRDTGHRSRQRKGMGTGNVSGWWKLALSSLLSFTESR